MQKLLLAMIVAVVVLGFIVLRSPGTEGTSAPQRAAASVTARDGVLDAGSGYVVALDIEGRVFGWGGYDSNEGAKLIAGGKRPRLLLAGSGYRRVAAGTRAVYAIDVEGTLRRAALADISASDGTVVPLPIHTAKRWRIARETWAIGAGIDRDGALWWWDDDAVADAPNRSVPDPNAQPQSLMPGVRFVDACLQGPRLHAIDEEGRAWRSADLLRRGSSMRPLQGGDGALVRLEADVPLAKLACRENASHVLALARDGSIWGYGPNSFGELGVGAEDMHPDRAVYDATTLVRIADGPFVAIAVAPQVSFAIAGDGALWGWGRNLDSELGLGNSESVDGPQLVDQSPPRLAVTATYGTGIALDDTGRLQSWGSNGYGALGDGGVAAQHDRPGDVLSTTTFGGSL